jgi:hypothetical protein
MERSDMQGRSQHPPSAEEIKRQLEALVGHPLDISPDQLILFRYPVGSYAFLGFDENAHATWRSIFFPRKFCNDATLLEVCGASLTGANGKSVFRLSDVVCFGQVNQLSDPVNVVVTPRSDKPFYTTVTYTFVNSNADLEITVFAWDAAGAPAANVAFDWRCRVVSVPVIL